MGKGVEQFAGVFKQVTIGQRSFEMFIFAL